jgi:hypothetical protein
MLLHHWAFLLSGMVIVQVKPQQNEMRLSPGNELAGRMGSLRGEYKI